VQREVTTLAGVAALTEGDVVALYEQTRHTKFKAGHRKKLLLAWQQQKRLLHSNATA
jgi:hypothetical protein